MRNVLLSEKELEYIEHTINKKPFKRGYNPTPIRTALIEKIQNLPNIIKNFVEDLCFLQVFAEYKNLKYYSFRDKEGNPIKEFDDLRNFLIFYTNVTQIQMMEAQKTKPDEKKTVYGFVKEICQKHNITKITPQILSKNFGVSPKRASRGLNICVKKGLMKKVKKGVFELIPPQN